MLIRIMAQRATAPLKLTRMAATQKLKVLRQASEAGPPHGMCMHCQLRTMHVFAGAGPVLVSVMAQVANWPSNTDTGVARETKAAAPGDAADATSASGGNAVRI